MSREPIDWQTTCTWPVEESGDELSTNTVASGRQRVMTTHAAQRVKQHSSVPFVITDWACASRVEPTSMDTGQAMEQEIQLSLTI